MGGTAEELRERPVGERANERIGERCRVAGRNEEPGRPVLDDVGNPADAARDDAATAAERLDHDAAETLRPRRENEDGRVVERPGHLGRRERLGPARLRREVCDEPLGYFAKRAAPDDVESRVGNAQSREAPRRRKDVDGLVALEDADEQRDRPFGEGHAFRCQERLEVHERGELRCRLDPDLTDQRRGVGGDGAHAVAPAQPVPGQRVRERRKRLAPW